MKTLRVILVVVAFAVSARARPAVEGALAYYAFDDGNYVDGTTNAYDGYTYAGAPRFTNDVPPTVGGGKSLDLTGGNHAMGVADGGDFNPDTETVTVAFWIKGVPSGNWGHSISKGWGDNNGWAMRSRGEWNLGTAAGRRNLGLNLGDTTKWNHWVLSYQSTSVGPGLHQAWRNGNEWTASTGADGKITDVVQDFRIGFADGEYPRQKFDEVYIFDRLLTDEERLQLYEYVYPVTWWSPGVSNVTAGSADVFATLRVSGGSNAVAWLYWGTEDAGETSSAWGGTNVLNAVVTGRVESAISGLSPDTTYFYRFYGTNGVIQVGGWSALASFRTLAAAGEWDGSADDLWDNADNWSDTHVPNAPGDGARFGGYGAGDVDLAGTSYTVGSITLSGGDYRLVDNNATPGSLSAGTLSNSAGTNTIGVAMTVTGGTVNVSGGLLAGVHSNALGDAEIEVSNGTLALSSPGGDIAYASALTVGASSTLTAGSHGGGAVGPLTAAFGGPGNDITVSNGTLVVRTTDDYTLELRGNQTGAMNITGGDVSLATTATNLGSVTLSGGTLTANNRLTVTDLIMSGGTFVQAGVNKDLAVSGLFTLTTNLDMTSAALDVSGAAVTIRTGGSLADDVALPTLDALALNGGTLSVPGTITAATKFSFEPVITVTNSLAGTAEVSIGELRPRDGLVTFAAASNPYTGITTIHRATLVVSVNAANLGSGRLVFNSNNDGWPAVLQTSGTLARTIGNGAGQDIYWQGRGGFAAGDASLTVTLTRGDAAPSPLDWSSNINGFNNQVLQMGSVTATAAVELTNDIELDADRHVYTFDNPDSGDDVAVLSGDIVRDGTADHWLFKRGQGTLWLTGSNEFNDAGTAYGVRIENGYQSVLRAVDGAGLHSNALVYFNDGILESSGDFTRSIGNASGKVYWGNSGGFAAWGARLNVNLQGGAKIDWSDPNTGFNGRHFYLGSKTANDVVDFQNDIEVDAGRNVYVYGNPHTHTDYTIISGDITEDAAGRTLNILGDGEVLLNGSSTLSYLNIYNTATSGGSGSVAVLNRFDVTANTAVAPGSRSVGQLTITGGGELEMSDNAIYEWEIGPGGATDTIDVTGGTLDLDNFTLKILDADGSVGSDSAPLPVFTYHGGTTVQFGFDNAPARFDASALGGTWTVGTLALTDDGAGTIYLTGLSGGKRLNGMILLVR